MDYSHKQSNSQKQTVNALNRFIQNNNLHFFALKSFSCKYSQSVEQLIEQNLDKKKITITVENFKNLLGLQPSYKSRYIDLNIIPKLSKDISKYYYNFKINSIKEKNNKTVSYQLIW